LGWIMGSLSHGFLMLFDGVDQPLAFVALPIRLPKVDLDTINELADAVTFALCNKRFGISDHLFGEAAGMGGDADVVFGDSRDFLVQDQLRENGLASDGVGRILDLGRGALVLRLVELLEAAVLENRGTLQPGLQEDQVAAEPLVLADDVGMPVIDKQANGTKLTRQRQGRG